MRRLWRLGGKGKWVVLGLLALAAAGVWYYRTPLLTWYHLNNLAGATDADRQRCVDAVVNLDAEAVPGLLDLLKRDDARTCANAEAALSALLQRWGPDDGRSQDLLTRVEQEFATLSVSGQQAVLEMYLVRLQPAGGQPAAAFVQAAGRLLPEAARPADPGVRGRALALAEVMVEHQPKENLDTYRALVRKGLADAAPDNRVRAVHLTLHSALKQESDLLRPMVPLLRDPEVRVRRAALLTLSLADQVVTVEELMPLLHDPDAEVRRLCVKALIAFKLTDQQIRVARLYTDPHPMARLDVFDELAAADLEPGIWLRRLSQDSEKAVRAAAVRAAAEQPFVDLSDRLRQMSQEDASPTVRQLSAYYLRLRAAR
jgi:HEAT repeat protein